MARKKKKEVEGAPQWMMTMGDMNTLLMTFFIILFSLSNKDKLLYMDLKSIFREMGKAANPAHVGPNELQLGLDLIREGQAPGMDQHSAPREHLPRPRGKDLIVSRRGESVIWHLEDAYGFGEGEYLLTPAQRGALDAIKDYMQGRRQTVVIRGFTDSDPRDALVLTEEKKIRPATAEDPVPDHHLLSSLRAQEVRRYLCEGQKGLSERQVRLAELGTAFPAETAPEQRGRNRRVEVVIGSQTSLTQP